MDKRTFEHPVNEKATKPSPIRDAFWTNFEKPIQQKTATKRIHGQIEFTEIDLFTGRIRTIRRK